MQEPELAVLRKGFARVLTSEDLGNAYRHLGETRRAIELFEQSLAIQRSIGDRRGEANS